MCHTAIRCELRGLLININIISLKCVPVVALVDSGKNDSRGYLSTCINWHTDAVETLEVDDVCSQLTSIKHA